MATAVVVPVVMLIEESDEEDSRHCEETLEELRTMADIMKSHGSSQTLHRELNRFRNCMADLLQQVCHTPESIDGYIALFDDVLTMAKGLQCLPLMSGQVTVQELTEAFQTRLDAYRKVKQSLLQ